MTEKHKSRAAKWNVADEERQAFPGHISEFGTPQLSLQWVFLDYRQSHYLILWVKLASVNFFHVFNVVPV